MNGTMQDTPPTLSLVGSPGSPGASDEPQTAPVDALFEHGLLGFPASRRFSLSPWGDDDGPFSLMTSLDDSTEFLVADPDAFFPGYEPEIDAETAEWLGIATPEEAIVRVIISVPDQAEHATANLLGPIVINKSTHRSIQMVLAEPWGTRHSIFETANS